MLKIFFILSKGQANIGANEINGENSRSESNNKLI